MRPVPESRANCKYSVNPSYPALERLPFSGFQSSLIADRKGQCNPTRYPKSRKKANRSCGRARQLRGAMNPLYPALNRLPFSGFQSSLIADRKRQCNLARDRNPAKGKPLLRQGAVTPRRNEPFISRLEPVAFFRVSKLIRCPYQRQCTIRPAVETLQKANRSCGRARMAISTVDRGFTEYLP